MRGSEVQEASPLSAGEARWLLIGNSRWHWAAPPLGSDGPLRVWDELPWDGPLALESSRLLGWAGVGAVSVDLALPPEARLQLVDVPLQAAPPWLGIDRALAGWWGWRLVAAPVLVADAGTVLSLTRVDREGGFAGGRLLAGAALQLRAMASGTAQLPALDASAVPADVVPPPWPQDTADAMRSGVLRGLAAAITAAVLEVRREAPACRLLLTGGDGTALAGLLDPALEVELRPHLCLEALAALRPGGDQPSPRSLRI